MTCETLVPQPGIKPVPPAMEAWSLNQWTTKEIPNFLWFCHLFLGTKGRNKGEFTNLQGVAASTSGKILIADSNNQCVQVWLLIVYL